jgi:hypothetical protein
MNQAAYQELTKMLNAFPQSPADLAALLLTYDEDLTGISDQAICETAQRYRRGDIPDQNKTFAPSIAEFVASARRQEEYVSNRNKPRLPPPVLKPCPPEPPRQERTEEEKARVQQIMQDFHDSCRQQELVRFEAERAEIRARYGMTPDRLASIKDQPLPEGMVQVGKRVA